MEKGTHDEAGFLSGIVTLWGTQIDHLWDVPTLEQAKSVKSILPEEEETREIVCFSEATEHTRKLIKNLF